jgi:hypothetical protein
VYRFNNAPGEVALLRLREIVETRSDAAERGLFCVLVLPRGDEALAVNGNGNETAITVEDGYLVGEEQARDEIHKAGAVSVPIYFYNALLERPESVWQLLKEQVSQLRSHHERRLLEGAVPVGWVLAAPVFHRRRPAENFLDPATEATGRLGLADPDRLEDLEDVLDSDLVHPHLPRTGRA